jgi:hypothetical protein
MFQTISFHACLGTLLHTYISHVIYIAVVLHTKYISSYAIWSLVLLLCLWTSVTAFLSCYIRVECVKYMEIYFYQILWWKMKVCKWMCCDEMWYSRTLWKFSYALVFIISFHWSVAYSSCFNLPSFRRNWSCTIEIHCLQRSLQNKNLM